MDLVVCLDETAQHIMGIRLEEGLSVQGMVYKNGSA